MKILVHITADIQTQQLGTPLVVKLSASLGAHPRIHTATRLLVQQLGAPLVVKFSAQLGARPGEHTTAHIRACYPGREPQAQILLAPGGVCVRQWQAPLPRTPTMPRKPVGATWRKHPARTLPPTPAATPHPDPWPSNRLPAPQRKTPLPPPGAKPDKKPGAPPNPKT